MMIRLQRDDASEPAEEPADEPEEPADEPAGDFPEGPALSLGTLLPETGPLAFLGAGMVPSVQLAVADMNAAGANISLVTGDSGTDPDIAHATV